MIKVRGLKKTVSSDKIPVLRGIDFDLVRGEFVAIVGPSGSGKSMLLRCLALREKWDGGTFVVDETDVFKGGWSAKMKVRREWAYLQQNPDLDPNRTALKNVLIGQVGQTPAWRRLTGMVRTDDYMGAMDMLESLGLLDKAKNKSGTLSGGEKQRVATARALAHGANVLLADEPVIGLDPHTADSVLGMLKQLCEKEEKTVVAVLPIELAERHAHRIWGMDGGKIVLDIRGRRLTTAEKSRL
ncbi:ATP-binding cassette domain-containing protein [Saccharibacillus sp. CPCC 101409]|uniref:phosphonate ABC transporter ATP-binding protein n=1 Tax=Saccharibacillus sp. CPCC 101409 TaxID=3058041 RepID=UPI00267266B3|nr:ATP-binding cassette domain-containing protein [Saccharibacillus sp. CPCC 101409]MDO3412866.1 ATP-binding cassette domain-containing protein [Saccharibacillus sp. CPCC 101409]